MPRFTLVAVAVFLAACSGNAAPFDSLRVTTPAWYREAPAIIKKGVYVAEYYTNDILGYDWNTRANLPPICSLPAAFVVDVTTDTNGNLIDPDGGSRTVTVFRGPAMCGSKLGSFADGAGQPADAATQNAATNTIYVANLQATGKPYGDVSVCSLKSGCGTVLSNPAIGGQLFSVAEDAHGNVYASGYRNPSVSGYGGGSALIVWKGGAGKGATIAAYRNKTPGGLEFDKLGNLLALDTFARSLWIYTGCPKRCSAHGPFALKGRSVYAKLDAKNALFEAADFEYGQVDVYSYAGTRGVTYLYSFNAGMTPSGDVEGIAIDPAG
ncbi:MAG TPA: hypothetical protein VMT95_11775 [Candidatus Binatia bacterium]|nr:hypothetical protein [Candidatus Binatia bacterium]